MVLWDVPLYGLVDRYQHSVNPAASVIGIKTDLGEFSKTLIKSSLYKWPWRCPGGNRCTALLVLEPWR